MQVINFIYKPRFNQWIISLKLSHLKKCYWLIKQTTIDITALCFIVLRIPKIRKINSCAERQASELNAYYYIENGFNISQFSFHGNWWLGSENILFATVCQLNSLNKSSNSSKAEWKRFFCSVALLFKYQERKSGENEIQKGKQKQHEDT